MKYNLPLTCIFIFSFGMDFALGILDSKKVEEGTCENVEDDLARDVAMNFFTKKAVWNIVVASEHCFLSYAETFLGRPVKDEAELSKICLHLEILPINSTSFSVVSSGYNRTIKQICTPSFGEENQVQEKCTVIEGSSGTKTLLFEQDYRDFVILTDSKTYAVIVLCLRGIRTYKIMSITPVVPQNVVDKVKLKVAAMGFNPQKMRKFPCQK